MKHIFTNSNESAVVRNGYRCAKVARPLRTVFLIGTLLLTLGVGQMWAEQMCDLVSSGDVNQRMPNYEAGYNMGSINVWFSINGASYSSKSSSASDINSNRAISASNITSGLKFNKFSVPVYCHNQNHSDACSNNGARIVDQSLVMSWKVSNPSGTQVGSGDFITTTNVSLSWSGNGATGTWTSNTSAKDLLSGVTASTTGNLTYTMDFWYKFCCHMYNSGGSDWGSNVNVWYPGNSQNFKYQFTIPQTTLTVNHSGDDGTATASSGISSSIALNTNYTLTASEVTGYDFVNWTTSDASITITSATSRTGAKVKFTSFTSATITANYSPKTYNGTIDANGGAADKSYTATYDATSLTISSVPTRTGYNLSGYYEEAACTHLIANTSKALQASTSYTNSSSKWNYTSSAPTLYAGWTAKTYTITLNKNGADCANNGSATATYNSGSVSNATYPTYTDYRCDGYYTTADGGSKILNTDGTFVASTSYTDASGNWTNDGDLTLYAHWTYDVTNYTVNFGVGTSYTSFGSLSAYNNTTSAALGASPQSVRSGHSVTFTASPNTGYEVEGWYTDAACTEGKHDVGSTTYTTSITGATNVYVKFVEKTWSVAFAAGVGGSVTTPAATPQTVGQVTGISIEATPSTGYTFNSWSSSSGGSFTSSTSTNSNTFKPTANTTVTASFTETKHTVSITGGTGDSEVGIATTATVTANAAVTGKKFDHWNVTGTISYTSGNANSRSITFTATTNVTLTAVYADRSYTKVYFAKPSGWTNVYAYAWKPSGTGNGDYPGVQLTQTETVNCVTYYYYKYYTDNNNEGDNGTTRATWTKIIFNKGAGSNTAYPSANWNKTQDLTLTNGHFYHCADGNGENSRNTATVAGSTSGYDWYVCGYWNQSTNKWGFDYPIPINCSTHTGNVVIDVTSSRTQEFKIYQASTDKWFKYTGGPSLNYDNNYDITSLIGQSLTMREYNLNRNTFTSSTNSYRFTLDVTNANNPVLVVSPGTDNDYSATLSINSFGHGSIDPAAGAITLHQYTPTTITATPEAGYRFKQWNVSGVTCSNSTAATATFTASAAGGTIEAEFTQEGIIYFDNTMSQWKGDIYVYFFSNNAWYDNVSDSKGPGMVPTVNSRGYGKMTRISSSNVYYFNYHEASITPTQYIGFTKGDHHTSNGVYQTSAAYLKNFDSCFPMYLASQNWTTTNATGYHNAGYWKRYNVTESGFDIRGLNSTWTADLHPFTSTTPNSNTFKTTVTLNNATHEFKIYRCYGAELGNNGKMTPVNHSGWEMTPGTNNCRIEAPSGGDYEFTLNLGSDHIYLSVEFPLLQDDYRLLYTGRITTDGSDSHKHPSQSIRHLTGNNKVQKDTISFWIDKDHQGTIQLQQCTNPAANGGKGSWSNITSVSYSGVTKTGIYNFVITQTTNGSGARTVTATPLSENFKYEDDLYIRTDASDGGWEAYKYVEDNKLEYSEWARDHSGYDYYHCYFAGTGCNVHFTIANKYSSSLTDTLTTDAIVTTGNLRYQCNVRFMYTSSSNKIGRAYLNGSSETGDNEFLVLQGASSGAQIKKKDGTALDGNKTKLDDNGNWIYSIDIKADETARVKLISNYRFDGFDHNQWFIGTSAAWSNASTEQILGGNTPSKSHLIRVIYDFKTNHLISAWLADGEEVDEVKAINTSVMIVREHQLDAEQITFSGGKLTEVGTVYCVMKFNKWTLNNKAKAEPHSALAPLLSPYERGLYWISFPFDVKLNDVFGFGQYGQHWIIEYYDGKTRAQKGFWSESPVNWKYVMPSEKDDYILKANVGYVLALDLDEMTESSHVWDYVEDVHLYFPSKDPVHNILQKDVSVDIDQDGYQCTINRTTEGLGPEYDRRIRDSYWHCIGVPSFANNAHTLKHDGWAEEDPDYPDLDDPEDDWTAASLPFYYAWNPETNALAPYSDGGSLTFKAMNSYLVQYSQATMSWTNVSTPSASIVARKKAKAEDIHFTEFKLELMKGEESMDYTFIRLTDNEEVTSGFEFGHDLCKEFNNGKANIYTFIEDLQVAGNSLPLESEKTTIVPVGVKTSAAGEYTFAMPEGTNGIGVTLVDNETGDRTNLAMSDYSVTLNTGTIDGRFVLEISPVAQTPTGIEEVTGDGLQVTGARKVMVDGVLYIVKEGKVFNAQGARCK